MYVCFEFFYISVHGFEFNDFLFSKKKTILIFNLFDIIIFYVGC